MNSKEYLAWLWNPANSHECDGCPYNEDFTPWQNQLPCGQQQCWVDAHTRHSEEGAQV